MIWTLLIPVRVERFWAFLFLIRACCDLCEEQWFTYTWPDKGGVRYKHSCNMKGIIKGLNIQRVCLAVTVIKLKFQALECSNINWLLQLNYLRVQICHDLSVKIGISWCIGCGLLGASSKQIPCNELCTAFACKLESVFHSDAHLSISTQFLGHKMQFIRVTAEILIAEMLNRWLISQRWILLLV